MNNNPICESACYLIPYPQRLTPGAGKCALSPHTAVRILSGKDDVTSPAASEIYDTAELLLSALASSAGIRASLRASPAPAGHPDPDIKLLAGEALDFSDSPDAYRLRIAPEGITLEARTVAGLFYGAQTLRQLLLRHGASLPALTIEDWPDLPHRGVMLDISRGKVPTLDSLKALATLLAGLKINQLQLYIEHTFAFERHPLPGQGHSPLTPEEILALDVHCRSLHMALVPNLQSFGHLHEVLIHERYKPLAESDFRGGWTLSPVVPEIYDFLAELYAEFLPLFSHRPVFNVCCDETWDLGKGKSKPLADARGLGRVYLDHLLKVRRLIEPFGCRMAFWGDILEQHPELIPELPRDVILLNWYYDAHGQEARYLSRSRPAQEAGLEHWVCPGTSSWLSFFFRKDNARDNIATWAGVARETGARGLLNTDWGDAGHLNCISYSYWSFVWGADRAWRTAPDKALEKEPALFDRRFLALILPGAPEKWLEPLEALGNLYQAFTPSNGAPAMVHRALLNGKFTERDGKPVIEFFYGRIWPMPSVEELLQALEISELACHRLEEKRFAESDELRRSQREWRIGAELGACACLRGLAFYGHPAAGTPEARRRRLREVLDKLEIAWTLRNKWSDWFTTRKGLEEAEP